MKELMIGNKKIKIHNKDKYTAYAKINESNCMFTKKGIDQLKAHTAKVYTQSEGNHE